jgi:hypothetical protein
LPDVVRAGDRRLRFLGITPYEEARQHRGDVAEHREAVERQQHRQDAAFVGLRPELAADGGQQHHRPPQRVAIGVEAASDVARRLEKEHPRRAERDHQQRHCADIAELAPGERAAQRVHAAIGAADDAHQLQPAHGARRAEHRQHTKDAQRGDDQREQDQPVALEISALARGQDEADREVGDEHDPQHGGDAGEERVVAGGSELDDDDNQPQQAEQQHRRVEPRLQPAQGAPSLQSARHRA